MFKYHGHVSFEKRGYDQNGKYTAHTVKRSIWFKQPFILERTYSNISKIYKAIVWIQIQSSNEFCSGKDNDI